MASTSIRALYARFDRRAVQWATRTGVSCPTGCGRCCATTVPTCTRSEARLIALHLVDTHHARLGSILSRDPDGPEGGPPCPFYDAASDFHCTIYAVRPFICRAFGYASATDKTGRPVYRLCEHMPAPESFAGGRTLPAGVAGAALPMPPRMANTQSRIDALSQTPSPPEPLDRAVRGELERILIARQYARAEAFADAGPDTDPSPPIAPDFKSA